MDMNALGHRWEAIANAEPTFIRPMPEDFEERQRLRESQLRDYDRLVNNLAVDSAWTVRTAPSTQHHEWACTYLPTGQETTFGYQENGDGTLGHFYCGDGLTPIARRRFYLGRDGVTLRLGATRFVGLSPWPWRRMPRQW